MPKPRVSAGTYVRKREKSSLITFWSIGTKRLVKQADGTEKLQTPFLLRYHSVFNLDQTEGIAEKLGLTVSPRVPDIAACETVAANMPNAPAIVQDGKAWYKPATDTIGIPAKGLFDNPQAYYATLFHEMTHSTGHASRIRWEGIEKVEAFGSEVYSREELIAELGAAMLCGVTGIIPATIENSTAYLQGWINRLKGDSKPIMQAASAAQRASDYIQGIAKPSTQATPEHPEITESEAAS